MTTGSTSTGIMTVTWPGGLIHQRAWTGTDGKTIPGRVSRKSQWNAYTMAVRSLKSNQANKILIHNPVVSPPLYPGPQLRNNHSYSGVAGCRTGTISSVFPNAQFDSFWNSREELALQAKLVEKVKGHSYNIGVSLAETDKLANTATSTISAVGGGVVDLLKGNFRGFARRFGSSPPSSRRARRLMLTDISGRFLEMRYAWEPAISDFFEAAKAFEAISNGPRQQSFRSARRRVVMEQYTTNYSGGILRRTISRQYIFEMYEEMSAFRQMGLMNPLSIVWERIPWSFAIYWFIPVGSYRELIGQVPFMKGRWCRTDKMQTQISGMVDKSIQTGGYDILGSLPDMYAKQLNLRRLISFTAPSVPRPTLAVAGAVQGKRVYNAVALAHQIFAKAATIPHSRSRGYSQRDLAKPISNLELIAHGLSQI